MRPCTRVDVLHREEKKHSLHEGSIDARTEDDRCAARCCELLVKRRELLASPRDFSAHFPRVQEMPMECGLLARAGAAMRRAIKKIHDARERRASAGIASPRPTKGHKKFFCIIVRNPLPIAPDAVRIARIGGCPDSLQRCLAPRSSRSSRSSRSKMRVARSATRPNGVDPHLDRIGDVPKRRSRASIRGGHAATPAAGEHARAESGSALRRSRSLDMPNLISGVLRRSEATARASPDARVSPTTGETPRLRAKRMKYHPIPSLAFSRSLTACGFALPPEDFITCPTNQPTIAGLALACSALSGLAAMMSATSFSIAPTSVTCLRPRASTIAPGSPPSVHTISNKSLAILPEIVPFWIRSRIAPSCTADTGDVTISLPSRFSRPNNSLMIQLAAALASRLVPSGRLTTASK